MTLAENISKNDSFIRWLSSMYGFKGIDGERRANCDVWLERYIKPVVTGSTVVALIS